MQRHSKDILGRRASYLFVCFGGRALTSVASSGSGGRRMVIYGAAAAVGIGAVVD